MRYAANALPHAPADGARRAGARTATAPKTRVCPRASPCEDAVQQLDASIDALDAARQSSDTDALLLDALRLSASESRRPCTPALQVVPKQIRVGPRGGAYYVNARGRRVHLKRYQREQCRAGSMPGVNGTCPRDFREYDTCAQRYERECAESRARQRMHGQSDTNDSDNTSE